MILDNSVPNLKSVAPKLQKLSHRKVSINVARTNKRTNEQQQQRHQSGKTYSLVEMKFRRDKNNMLKFAKTYFMTMFKNVLKYAKIC